MSTKSDVFGLGMTALQLLCGLSDNELAQVVLSGALDRRFVRFRGKCSRQLADVIGNMCHHTGANRPALEETERRLCL